MDFVRAGFHTARARRRNVATRMAQPAKCAHECRFTRRNAASMAVKNIVNNMTATVVSRRSWICQTWPAASVTSPDFPVSQGTICESPALS